MDATRSLIVVADDFGIGPATSKAIVKLGAQGVITGASLMVTSPYAEDAVEDWKQAGQPMELGWQPCLTLDSPVLPPQAIPSLVNPDGTFFSLRKMLSRVIQARARWPELKAELQAQYERFVDLVGHPPVFVAPYQNIQLAPRVGTALLSFLNTKDPKPYFRRARETFLQWVAVPGARWKRWMVSTLGRRYRLKQERWGFPGSDYLAGLSNPGGAKASNLIEHWLTWTPGKVVELCCRPGFYDGTLINRAAHSPRLPRGLRWLGGGHTLEAQLEQRLKEREMLESQAFLEMVQKGGFTLRAPSYFVEKGEEHRLRLVA